MRKQSRLLLRVGLLILVLAGSVYGILRFRQGRRAQDLPTAAARLGEFAVLVRCRGTLVSAKSIQLTAPLDVQDLQILWLAPAGGAVKAGQVVVRFDPSKLRQDLKEKTAALDQAEASLQDAIAQARITSDQDNLDLASARYDMEKARLEASKKAIVSAMDGQKSAIDLGLAQEKVNVQQATIELHKKSGEAKIASQRRLRDEARAERDRTLKRLSQMELKSPIDGVINYLTNRTQGWMSAQPFKVGDHVYAGLEIAEIPDLKTLEMESKVDEVDRGRISVGQGVRVHIDAFPEQVVNAVLITISPLTEQDFAEWPPTRTFRAFAALHNPDARLRPGMNAGADIIETRIPNAISIPSKALFMLHGKPVVYVKVQDSYRPKEVTVQARNPDEVAVNGIAPGTAVALTEPEQKQI